MAAARAEGDRPQQVQGNALISSEKERLNSVFANGGSKPGNGVLTNDNYVPGKPVVREFPIPHSSSHLQSQPLSQHVSGMVMAGGHPPQYAMAGYGPPRMYQPGYAPHAQVPYQPRAAHPYPAPQSDPGRGPPLPAAWDGQRTPSHLGYGGSMRAPLQPSPQQQQLPRSPNPQLQQQSPAADRQTPPPNKEVLPSEVTTGGVERDLSSPRPGRPAPTPPPAPAAAAAAPPVPAPPPSQVTTPSLPLPGAGRAPHQPPLPPQTAHNMSPATGAPLASVHPDGVGGPRPAPPQQPYPPPPGATPLIHKPAYVGPPAGYRPADPHGLQYSAMYGSPYGRAVPAPAPTGQQPYTYPGQQPWSGSPSTVSKPGGAAHQCGPPSAAPAPGAAPPTAVSKPAAARRPVSPHMLRHQMSQKLQYGASAAVGQPTMPPPPPARPSSQGSDASLHEPPPPLVGPDGAPLDECSQHSTLSNASANSEERSRSPKRPTTGAGGGTGSQPATPLSGLASPGGPEPPEPPQSVVTAASPGAGSNASGSSHAWARSPGTKAESLSRLFEMDDNPARREWVNRLLSFMEERGTPILQCPTVSKQPLDLFRLYHYTRERGGFEEVSTAKTWKDVAALLGIGSSSSGAYTLRKHYMKSLLPFECHFDRGGIDPAPIIAKWETKASRSRSKAAASPGPQESFSNPGSLDGFPPGYAPGYPPRPEYNGTAPPPHGYPTHGYPAGPGAPQPPGFGQYPPPPSGQPPRPGQEYPPPPPPPPPPQQQYMQQQYPTRSYPGGSVATAAEYRYPGPPPGPSTYGARPLYPGAGPAPPQQQRTPPPPPSSTATTPGAGQAQPPAPAGSSSSPAGTPPPPQQQQPTTPYSGADYSAVSAGGAPSAAGAAGALGDQYQAMTGPGAAPTLSRQLAAPPPSHAQQLRTPFSHGGASGTPEAGFPGTASPRRPPPFSAPPGQQHLSQPQPMHQQYGWRGSATAQLQTGAQWTQRYATPAGAASPGPGQWSAGSPQTPPRPVARPARPPPTPAAKQAAPSRSAFPPDSVEATAPVMARRRRGTRADLGPVDGWRLTLALRSGQLAESRWALDVLQILSYDDSAVAWLDLAHMPGLLAALLQHLRAALAAMFARRPASGGPWYDTREEKSEDAPEPDLGRVRPADPAEKRRLLSGADFSRASRCGRTVQLTDRADDILVSDGRRAWEADVLDVDAAWEHVLTHVTVESGRVAYQRRLPNGALQSPTGEQRPADEEGGPLKHPTDERLAGFEAPGFFLERLRRTGPAAASGAPSPNTDRVKDGSAAATVKREQGTDERSAELSGTLKTQSNSATGECEANNGTVKSEIDCEANSGTVKSESSNSEPMECDSNTDNVKCMSASVAIKRESDGGALRADPSADERPSSASRLQVRDPSGALKRRRPEDEEEECHERDQSSLYLTSETQENMAVRCLAACTVLRNLSFVPGNECELSRDAAVLSLLGDLLQLHHSHPARAANRHTNYDRDEDAELREPCPALAGDQWWAPQLAALHEAALVTLANISGQLRLAVLPEPVSRPVLDGLLHWLQCPAAYAGDPLPAGAGSACPQMLALEALCRLCVHPENVDLVLATPPVCRWERVCRLAAGWAAQAEHQVRREMALTLLHALAAVDERVALLLVTRTPGFVATLVRFVEAAEQSALSVASAQGVNALRDNPELMGTSLDVLGRAAALLLSVARLSEAGPPLRRCEHRLLALVTSQILDQRVAATLAQVLYLLAECQQPAS